MPMNCTEVSKEAGLAALAADPGVAKDIERVCELWDGLRAKYGVDGPLLFGAQFSMADVMFAPVCFRFKTFQPPLTVVAQAYVDAMLSRPELVEWVSAAEAEGDRIAHYDAAASLGTGPGL